MSILRNITLSAVLMTAALLPAASAHADNLSLKSVTVTPGSTADLVFSLENATPYYGFQADILLPEGLTASTLGDGKTAVTLSQRFDSSYKPYGNTLSDGTVRVGTFSGAHTPISGNSGELFTLTVSATGTFDGGVIKISGIKMIDSADRDVVLPSLTVPVTVAVDKDNSALYIADFDIVRGETQQVSVILDNTTPFTAFQTDITLPDCLTLVPESVTLTDRSAGHTFECKTSGNVTRVTAFSGNNASFVGNDGALLTFSVVASDALSSGEITLTNSLFTTKDFKEYRLEDSSARVSVINQGVTSVQLNKSSLTMYAGDEETLVATVLPDNAFDKSLKWSVAEKSVATVDDSGKVTAIAVGETTLQVVSTVNPDAKAECKITVIPTPLASVTVKATGETTLRDGQKTKLTAEFAPADATEPVTVTWTSDDDAIASVDNTGTVTAHAKTGTVTVTATANNPADKEVKGSIQITVEATPAEKIELNAYQMTLQASKTYVLTATVLPVTATDKTVTWKSDNPLVANVDDKGLVTAYAAGNANIMAICGDAFAKCEITVIAIDAEMVVLSDYALNLKVPGSAQLSASVIPSSTTDKTITWSTDNPDVATVSDNGLVTAVAIGMAKITASCGSVSAVCQVIVEPTEAEDVIFDKSSLALIVGQTHQANVSIVPENTTDKTVAWKSDNTAVATVDDSGLITAVGEGKAIITATCGRAEGFCEVTVKKAGNGNIAVTPGNGTSEGDDNGSAADNTADGGSLQGNDLTLRVGQTAGIALEVSLESDVAPVFEWTLGADGENIAKLTVAEGTLSASFSGVAIGQTTYSVKLANTDTEIVSGKVNVIGETPIASLTIEPAEVTMAQNALPLQLTATINPENASVLALNWTSSDEKVATVSADGKVTPVAQGTATITAATTDGTELSATCAVTVTAPIDDNFGFEFDESVTGEDNTVTLFIGSTYTFVPKSREGYVLPEINGWSSSDDETVSVDDAGKVTALKVGSATVTATALVNGQTVTASSVVNVIPIPASSLTLSADDATLLIGQSIALTAEVEPDDATDKTVVWSSDDEDVATVDDDGNVTAVSAGTANISAKCGEASATCVVTVVAPSDDLITVTPGKGTTEGDENGSAADNTADGGSLQGNDLTLRVGQTAEIALTLNANLTTVPEFIWTLDNGGDAYVTMAVGSDKTSAEFTGLAEGTTSYTIKVTGSDDIILSGKITVLNEDGSGVNDIATDCSDDVIIVFNLQGIRMNVSDRESLNSLPAGVYIVNGKKQKVR